MVADPTLLASFIARPSLAPTSNTVNSFELHAYSEASAASAASIILKAARRLDIHTIVIENDIHRPMTSQAKVDALIQILGRSGTSVRAVGQELVVTLPGRPTPIIWSATCRINRSWLWFGAVHVACPAAHSRRAGSPVIESAFRLPPAVGIGVSITGPHPLWRGMGEVAHVAPGGHGWLVDPAEVAAILGGLMCLCAIVLVPAILAISRHDGRRRNAGCVSTATGGGLCPTSTGNPPAITPGEQNCIATDLS